MPPDPVGDDDAADGEEGGEKADPLEGLRAAAAALYAAGQGVAHMSGGAGDGVHAARARHLVHADGTRSLKGVGSVATVELEEVQVIGEVRLVVFDVRIAIETIECW